MIPSDNIPHSSISSDLLGLREAIDHSLACFFLSRPDGTILDVNQAAVNLFGWSKEEIRQMGRDRLFDSSHPSYSEAIRERDQNGQVSAVLTAIHHDGHRFSVEFNSVLFQGPDSQTYASTFITDLTERMRTEREIQLLVNNTAEAYILMDKQLRILSFNQQFKRLYKRYFGIEIVKGVPILIYSPKNRLDAAKAIYDKVLQGETQTSEITVTHPEDGVIDFVLRYAPATDENGHVIGAFVTATDITEQRNSEKTLIESYQRFEFVTKATRDAIWDWNLKTGDVFWGDGFHNTFGYPKEFISGSQEEWSGRMHPEDRERVEAIVRDALASSAKSVSAEYRYRRADGSYAIVSDRAVIVRNEAGEPVRLVGAMQDITITRHLERQRVLLADIGQISAQSTGLQTMIDHSLHKIVTYGGYLVGEIWLVDSEQRFCYLASDYRGTDAAIQFRNEAKDIRVFEKGVGLPGRTWATETFQIIPDVRTDPSFLRKDAAIAVGLCSFFGIPLTMHGNVIGVLLLGTTEVISDLKLLSSQFDRLGPFLGMEIHRKQQEDLLRRIAWEQSHLVRAPLSRLLGLAELIQEGNETQADVDYMLSQIVSSAKELDHIIRGISSSTANLPTNKTP
jgi:PAS domain S-box-containing protein